jgi:hypothetical protein
VLSKQQFNRIVDALRLRPDPTLGSEKRQATRVNLGQKLVVSPVTNGVCMERITVLVGDLSIEGMGVLSGIPLRQGQKFLALLPTSETQNTPLLCEVIRCRIVANGLSSLGCRFLEALSETAAEALQAGNSAEVARIRKSVLE